MSDTEHKILEAESAEISDHSSQQNLQDSQNKEEIKRELNPTFSNDSIEEVQNVNETLDALLNISISNPYHPYHWPTWKKYLITVIYCLLQVFVTITSTSYVSVEYVIEERFNVKPQVATLGQSMFIVGTAIGPAFLGPLSDVGGRKWVYVVSIFFYAVFSIGCALPKNMAMLAIFMFLSGSCGSTALSNVAGSIADMFADSDGAGQPMAIFVMSANIGPSVGSSIGEWIGDNSHMGYAWVFWINVIFGGAFAIFLSFVPETLPRIVITNATKKEMDVPEVAGDVARYKINILQEMRFVTVMAFRILFTEPIVLFLGLYNGFAYGLLFLYLDGVFDVFVANNGLSYIGADLSYLNFVVGVCCVFIFFPIQTWFYKRAKARNGGVGKPEYRFLTSLVTVWGFPISLFWFAFTSNGKTSYWSPIVAGGLLGFSDPLLWLSMLSYITDSYPNVAGSAVAAFTIPSFLIAAALAHAGVAMFDDMSTTWAFATLAFISLGIVALVYGLYFFGPKLRARSKLTR